MMVTVRLPRARGAASTNSFSFRVSTEPRTTGRTGEPGRIALAMDHVAEAECERAYDGQGPGKIQGRPSMMVDDAHDQHVGPAPDVAGDHAQRRPEQEGEPDGGDLDLQRDPRAVEDA